jgi:DNA replication and repair protein RecF
MKVLRFGLGGLRVFAEAEFFPGPGINWFTGQNGAGKSSIVEAAYVLGHGRSFRAVQIEQAVRTGSEALWVSAEVESGDGGRCRLGVRRARQKGWEQRVDGGSVQGLSEVARRFPVLCFEPGSHHWISGPAERRRRLIDWGVFHVEQGPLVWWTEYQRALRQRNAALRTGDPNEARAWEPVLAEVGERINALRKDFCQEWGELSLKRIRSWSSDLAKLELSFRSGWGAHHADLVEALAAQRDRDLGLGYTYAGPHRADLGIRLEGVEARERLSRGQAKLLALALLIGLSEVYRLRHGSAPLLLLDDLGSELDDRHGEAVLAELRAAGAQVWLTGVERPSWGREPDEQLFHVEQGRITPLV